MKFKIFIITVLATVMINHCWAQSIPLELVRDSIQLIMDEQEIPGLFVSVVSNDSILWQEGLGYANVDADIKVTSKQLFRMGSVSKTFTALAIMKLVNDGKLSLDDELKEIAPEIPFENKWEVTHPVKIKHLLEHKAGFDDMHFSSFFKQRTAEMSALDEVLVYKNSLESRWKPGLVHSYSNPGYAILGYIIEKFGKKPYQEYIEENVLTPLGMERTHFISERDSLKNSHYATGYTNRMSEVKEVGLIGEAMGGLLSNAEEMSHFLQYFISKTLQDSLSLIGKKGVLEMEELHSEFEQQNGIERGYSLGLYTREFGSPKHEFYGHSGYIKGFASDFIYSRDLNLGIVVSNNSGDSNRKIINLLVHTFAPQKSKLQTMECRKKKLTQFKPWEGQYRILNSRNQLPSFLNIPFRTVNVKTEDSLLVIARFLGSEERYIFCGQNAFKEVGESYPTVFLADNEGEESLYYYEDLLVPVNSFWFFVFRLLLSLSLIGGVMITLLFIFRLVIYPFKHPLKRPLIIPLILAIPYWLITGAITIFLKNSSPDNIAMLGEVNSISITIFIFTLLFPVFCLTSGFILYKRWQDTPTLTAKIFYAWAFAGAFFLTSYCAYNDWFALRLWSY